MAENEDEMIMDEEDESGSMNQDDIAKMIEEMEQAKQEGAASGASADASQGMPDMSAENQVDVEQVQLDSFFPGAVSGSGINLNLLMNISLSVSIELGRTEMMIKDILRLGVGSIVELNKVAGEHIDLLVNNKRFAEGEVVVIDENFGIRITKLIKSPYEAEPYLESKSKR
ncbi:flagellar motor switch protein FliN [candidate division KSB1 bacterium]|nr:flagellar motor switch protein FliN [candidate division KSB1 bacterium]